jgi:general secretion pathway protein K
MGISRHPSRARRRARQRGIALLLVLWVMMTLGVIAADFASYIRDDATAALNVSEETRSYFVAVAGLNRALFEQLEATKMSGAGEDLPEPDPSAPPFPFAPPDGFWHDGLFGDAKFRVRMTYETGRIPINCGIEDADVGVRRTLLTTVVKNLLLGGNRTKGVGRREDVQVRAVVDSIIDWTDLDDEHQPEGAESEYYSRLDPPYEAKNNLINSPEELLGVKGMTSDLLYGAAGRPGLRDVISVYQMEDDEGACRVDGRRVSKEVLQALGADPDTAQELIALRDANPADFTAAQVQFAAAISPELGPDFLVWENEGDEQIISIEAEADLAQPRNRSHVAAVIEVNWSELSSVSDLRVKRWQDRAPWTFGSDSELQAAEPGSDS